jgi:hypothetical protein
MHQGGVALTSYLEQLAQVAALVNPVAIPDCLQRPEYQFCKVGWTRNRLTRQVHNAKADATAKSVLKQFKMHRGARWQTDTYSHSDPDLNEWINAGGNYGIVAGVGWEYDGSKQAKLFIHDADDLAAWTDAGFFDDLPSETLQVKSSSPNKRHTYWLSDIQSRKAQLGLPGMGHFKFYASYCVAPGSLHPSGIRYEVIDNHQPAPVDAEILTTAILQATRTLCPNKLAIVKEDLVITSV